MTRRLALQSGQIDRSIANTRRNRSMQVLIDDTSSVLKLTAEVVLVNEEGTWRVDDELTEVVLQ